MFNSYVKLPEGKPWSHDIIWYLASIHRNLPAPCLTVCHHKWWFPVNFLHSIEGILPRSKWSALVIPGSATKREAAQPRISTSLGFELLVIIHVSCLRGQKSHYSHWIWDAMSHDDHEALFDSGSDIHCMFGGDQFFRRVERRKVSNWGRVWTGVCRLSLSGWGKTHQQIQLFQEEDDHLQHGMSCWNPYRFTTCPHKTGVKRQSADASIGISLAVNSGFRAGHNLASSWRAAWSVGLRNRRSYAYQILPNGDRIYIYIYQKKETFPKFSQYIQNSLVMFSLKPSNFGNTFGPRGELTGHLRTFFARRCLSASFDDASFARSKGSQSEHEILLR